MLKRGYKNGAKIIEIYEGKLDLVLYNEKATTFYFYRFSSLEAIGREIKSNKMITNQKEVRKFLSNYGKKDYKGFINELLMKAFEAGMEQRYEM